ncbi:c-type cytochrome [Natronohydrobacter thiooxidans]|uniref:c-type cytochrome n=1 Tax=Natronohydrobacter thiooxidans TaxID=87172 RepID=UPI0008FF1D26|nr:cytochrome c [Natronohydrobacter thiooxidans]
MLTRSLSYAVVALIVMTGGVSAQQSADPQVTQGEETDSENLLERFSEESERFTQSEGEALYRTTCQACHMEDGEGSAGAGAHPPLANNPKMNSKHFVAGVILIGYHGMPGFSGMMSDEQVAAVTNYVRTRFGNDYPDPIAPEQVEALRPPDDSD